MSREKLGTYKLNFKLVYWSGEDPEHPITELLTNNPHSRGWHTPKFCEYPQEVILQFSNLVRIRRMQLLAHEYKIPTTVEFFSYIPDGP